MIYYINAYAPDTENLRITTARIRELDPNATIYIASDPAAPITTTIPGATTISPNYPRGGNLRGTPCIIGMLQTMAAILKYHNAIHIIKLDADTYLNSIDWLQETAHRDQHHGITPDLLAMERAEPYTISGDCYRISLYAIRAAIKAISARAADATAHGSAPEPLPEDLTICAATLRAGLTVHTIPYFHGLHRGLHHTLPTPDHLRAHVIHAGEPLANGTRAPREFVHLRLLTLWQATHPRA